MFNAMCWGQIEELYSPKTRSLTNCFAVWPSPVDHDALFQDAGFVEFADSDEIWDHAWKAFLSTIVDKLSSYGKPSARSDFEVTNSSLPSKEVEMLFVSTMDDQFPPTTIDFAPGPSVSIGGGNGLPLLWFNCYRTAIDLPLLLDSAVSVPLLETTLNWACLLPPEFLG